MPLVTLYGKPGCHLCDDARAVVERVRAERPFELARGRRDARSGAPPATTESASRYLRWTARSCSSSTSRRRCSWSGSIEWTAREVRRPHSGRRRASAGAPGGRAGGLGAALARGRCPSVAISAGPDPGEEDGARDDLVPGAGGLHARQLDPDPPRPVRLRQVRQARRGLQRRLARLADPQDPADHRQAQHRAVRRGQPGPGDRRARTSSPTTGSGWWRCSTRTRARSAARSATA